jgi:hypothetical protein
VTEFGVIDDLANERHLEPLLALAREGPVPPERIARLVDGTDDRYASHMVASLCDLAERGGIGTLERGEDGGLVLVPAPLLPTAAEAWERADATRRER